MSTETNYYTAEEAMKKLGKPRSTFFKEVENGLIPFELDPGRQRGRRYPKQAIDVLARRQKIRHKQKEPSHLIFTPASPADLWAEVQIGLDLYGEDDIVPFETLLEWRDVNDEMDMVVKDQGQVVGYSSLMPLDETIILPLIHDKIREKDIPAKAIKQWTDPQISVYICSLTVKPSNSAKKDAEVGRFLIKHTIKWALGLYRQFNIKNWYSIGATKKGQELLESLGFTEIVSMNNGERKGYFLEDIKKPVKVITNLLKEMQ